MIVTDSIDDNEFRGATPTMEYQMDKKMEHETETGVKSGLYGITTPSSAQEYTSPVWFDVR